MYYNSGARDLEAAFDYAAFSEKSLRMGFIRKVFGILSIQLLITFVLAGAMQQESVKLFFYANVWLYYVCYGVALASILAIVCCESARRQVPTNYILLGVFTMAESLMVGAVCLQYNTSTVILALLVTAAVAAGITLFAFQTKYDFTMCSGLVMAGAVVMLVFGLVLVFFPDLYQNNTVTLIYGCLGALVVSFYLVYDIQIMIGGRKAYALDIDDYVFAAIMLYLDLILLFQYILEIISSSSGN